MKSEDNPYLDKEWIQNKRQETTVEIFRQEYEASFEHHTGLVFPEWKNWPIPAGHVYTDSFHAVDDSYTHYRAIDPGSDNPTACLWAAIDTNGDVFIYDEYESQGLLTEVHAGVINLKTKYEVFQTIIDPAAAKRSSTDGRSIQDAYAEQGIYTYPANNDVAYGLQAVARYFRATLQDSTEHPRIYVHESCTQLRNELSRYVWDDWTSLVEKNKPDKPRKYKDHLVDCLRYLLALQPVHSGRYRNVNVDIKPRQERHNLPGRPTTGM